MRIALVSLMLISLALAQDRHHYMPNPKLTSGATIDVTRDDVCKPGYASPARKILAEVKHEVFNRYRVSPSTVGYNVDHLIPVSLGGSNSIKNLWPQPLSGEWSYHLKNKLEHKLHKMVCRGDLELKEAQQEIATDWAGAYKKYISEHERALLTSPSFLISRFWIQDESKKRKRLLWTLPSQDNSEIMVSTSYKHNDASSTDPSSVQGNAHIDQPQGQQREYLHEVSPIRKR